MSRAADSLAPPSGASAAALLDAVDRVIVGKRAVVRLVVAALLAQGHVLLQDVPGTGKTLLARALAASLAARFSRIQFTPDLLPSDITGASVYRPADGSFEFVPGPVFANIVLADEINRATPRTQSSLLEAMGEGQVTVEGVSRRLERPFFVIATQNPLEQYGTYPLPESQLDRFLLSLAMGYPSAEEEVAVLERQEHGDLLAAIGPMLDLYDVVQLQDHALSVRVSRAVKDYVVALARATRQDPEVALGASTRAAVALQRAAQAHALLEGRDYVLPDDVKLLSTPALAHRLVMRQPSADPCLAVQRALASVAVPLL